MDSIFFLPRLLKLFLLLSVWPITSGAQSMAPMPVEIPAAHLTTPLTGFLFLPKESTESKKFKQSTESIESPAYPAVVMLHGCGGAYANNGKLNARHQMWGEKLAAQGYAALMIDSFSARKLREICTIKFSERNLKTADRVLDAYAALAFLQKRPEIDPAKIGLLGWSHGGGVVLQTISQTMRKASGFNAAVAFYPGCSSALKKSSEFHPYAPLYLLIGEADDWTPAEPCKQLTQIVTQRGEPMQIKTYPNTYHDFDNPGITKTRVRKEVPNGIHPGQGVTVGPNSVAREDALNVVGKFFEEQFNRSKSSKDAH